MTENEIGKIVVDECIQLHRALGPGLLEIVYEVTLARRLEKRGMVVVRQVSVPIVFEGEAFDEGFRADLIIEGKVILELKSVEKVSPAHKKQILTYLKLTGLKLGFLLNFGEELMKEGITRTINGTLEEKLCAWSLCERIQNHAAWVRCWGMYSHQGTGTKDGRIETRSVQKGNQPCGKLCLFAGLAYCRSGTRQASSRAALRFTVNRPLFRLCI